MPILAEHDVSVHRLISPEKDGEPVDVETVILTPGDSIGDAEVPSYVLKGVKAGKVPGAKHVSDAEAKKVAVEKAAKEADNSQHVNASNADEDQDKA